MIKYVMINCVIINLLYCQFYLAMMFTEGKFVVNTSAVDTLWFVDMTLQVSQQINDFEMANMAKI